MDYRSQIKEKMGKLLFLEMNIEGFKESIGIPKYVKFKNKDLYLPISTEYISSNIENEINRPMSLWKLRRNNVSHETLLRFANLKKRK